MKEKNGVLSVAEKKGLNMRDLLDVKRSADFKNYCPEHMAETVCAGAQHLPGMPTASSLLSLLS